MVTGGEALAVVRSLFEAVHKRLPEADPKERVPLPDNPVSDVGYQHLLEIVNKDSPDEMIRPEGGAGKYRAGDLLYGVHKGVVSNPAGPRGQGRDISINIENRNTNTNGETPPAGDEAVRTAMLPRGVGRSWADRIGILSIAGGLWAHSSVWPCCLAETRVGLSMRYFDLSLSGLCWVEQPACFLVGSEATTSSWAHSHGAEDCLDRSARR